MNIIWAILIIFSAVCALVYDRGGLILDAALSGADKAVQLILGLCASFAVWNGVLKVLEEAGIQKKISRLLGPVIRFLFPKAAASPKASQALSANLTANLMGLGNAATPAGIKAVGYMKELSCRGDTASDEMCMFLVVNMSSLQIIPASVIALRAATGSANPADIMLPSLLATGGSTVFGILAAKLLAPAYKAKESRR